MSASANSYWLSLAAATSSKVIYHDGEV